MDSPPSRSGNCFARIRRIGAVSWSILGLIALTLVIAAGISALSGIVIPLVAAVIIGTILEPLMSWLVRLRFPKALAATLGLFVALATLFGVVAIVAWGFLAQLPEISKQISLGWTYAVEWVASIDVEAEFLDQWRSTLGQVAPHAGLGLLGFLTDTVYGVVTFLSGVFFSLFFLFFVLRDGTLFPAWLARVTTLDEATTMQVDSQVRKSLRGYFKGIAVTALITAPIFAIPLLLLKVPLVGPILILYFFLSFVPFLGAWLTGAFAVLIALGAGGPTAALIVALSLLISNGTIQSVVSSWALGTSLRMHPVLVLLATLIGGTVAGMIGMVLGAPLLAATQNSISALRTKRAPGPKVAEDGS